MEYFISLVLLSFIPIAIIYKRRYLLRRIAKGVPIALVLGTIWDYIAISRGWWSYGKDFLLGPTVYGIPVEDFLFFILVPAGAVAIFDLINNSEERDSR